MTSAEVNYNVHDKELLAIVCALDNWSHYLLGSPFVIQIYTDHRNLVYFRVRRVLCPRLLRWYAFFSQFQFILAYRRGELNTVADALSRRADFAEGGGGSRIEDCLLPDKYWSSDSRAAVCAVAGRTSSQVPSRRRNSVRLVDSRDEQLRIIRARHCSVLTGHPGRKRTFDLIARDFSWPGMRGMIHDFVDSCVVCQRAKASRLKPAGLLMPLEIPDRPWTDISMDFIVKLPKSAGYDSILVVVDRFSKMCHFVATREKINAAGTAKLILDNVVRLHGVPDRIVSDRGPQFISKFWKKLWGYLGCSTRLSSAVHPQTDGQTEVKNQALEQYLRCFVNFAQDDWSNYLSFAEFALNNSLSDSTGYSPFFINYGFHPRFDLFPKTDVKVEKIEDWFDELTIIQFGTRLALEKSRETQKKFADRKRRHLSFKVGDLVWLSTENLKTSRPCKKLEFRRVGPFEVLEKRSDVSYVLKLPDTMKIHPVFHVSLLSPVRKSDVDTDVIGLQPVIVEGTVEYVVKGILDSRRVGDTTEYLVKWKCLDHVETSWEPVANVVNCWKMVQGYHRSKPGSIAPSELELSALGKRLR